MTRTAGLLIILLAACTTTPPAIVDHWVPPQAATTVATKDIHCTEDPLASTPIAEAERRTTEATDGTVVQRPVPCVAQEISAALAEGVVRSVAANQRDAKPAVAGAGVSPQQPARRPAPRTY